MASTKIEPTNNLHISNLLHVQILILISANCIFKKNQPCQKIITFLIKAPTPPICKYTLNLSCYKQSHNHLLDQRVYAVIYERSHWQKRQVGLFSDEILGWLIPNSFRSKFSNLHCKPLLTSSLGKAWLKFR